MRHCTKDKIVKIKIDLMLFFHDKKTLLYKFAPASLPYREYCQLSFLPHDACSLPHPTANSQAYTVEHEHLQKGPTLFAHYYGNATMSISSDPYAIPPYHPKTDPTSESPPVYPYFFAVFVMSPHLMKKSLALFLVKSRSKIAFGSTVTASLTYCNRKSFLEPFSNNL